MSVETKTFHINFYDMIWSIQSLATTLQQILRWLEQSVVVVTVILKLVTRRSCMWTRSYLVCCNVEDNDTLYLDNSAPDIESTQPKTNLELKATSKTPQLRSKVKKTHKNKKPPSTNDQVKRISAKLSLLFLQLLLIWYLIC